MKMLLVSLVSSAFTIAVVGVVAAASPSRSAERNIILRLEDKLEIPAINWSCVYGVRDGGRQLLCIRSDDRPTMVWLGKNRVRITDAWRPVYSMRR